MAKTWADVAASTAFQSLSAAEQDEARQQYFEAVVAPRVPVDDIELARGQFDEATRIRKQDLPTGVTPSTAGGGRGSINPPMAAERQPVRTQAKQPTPYRDRREALDDAVNLLEEGADQKAVTETFSKGGIKFDEIVEHGRKRGSEYFKQQAAPTVYPEVTRPANRYPTPVTGEIKSTRPDTPLPGADVLLAGAKGVVGGFKMLMSAGGAGGKPTSAAEKAIKTADLYLEGLRSAAAIKDDDRIGQIMEEAKDGTWADQVAAAAKAAGVAPASLVAQGLGTSVPVILATLLPGVRESTVARLTAQIGLGAAQGAGATKESIYNAVKDDMLRAGVPKFEAEERAEAAQSYLGQNKDQIAVGMALGALASSTGVEKVIPVGQVSKVMAKSGVSRAVASAEQNVIGRGLIGGLTEAVPEFAQGSADQVAQNVAMQREGRDVPTFQGAVGQGALEAIAGFGAGAVTNAAFGRPQTVADQLARELNVSIANTDLTSADPTLTSTSQTLRQPNDAGPSAPSRNVSFTPADSPTAQAGLVPIVVGIPSATPAETQSGAIQPINPNAGQESGLDELQTGSPNVSTPGMAGTEIAAGSIAGSDQQRGGVGPARSDLTGAGGLDVPGAAVNARDDGQAVASGGAGRQLAASLTRPKLAERATDKDLLARTESAIAAAESGNAAPQPVEQWVGRKGDGYLTEADAAQALPGRQRMFPALAWEIEQMPGGKFRLAGYEQQSLQPAPTVGATDEGAGSSQPTQVAPITAPGGKPFSTEKTAAVYAQQNGITDYSTVKIDGGWAINPTETTLGNQTTQAIKGQTQGQQAPAIGGAAGSGLLQPMDRGSAAQAQGGEDVGVSAMAAGPDTQPGRPGSLSTPEGARNAGINAPLRLAPPAPIRAVGNAITALKRDAGVSAKADASPMTDRQQAASAVARMLGRTVTYLKADTPASIPNGFMVAGDSKNIFIASDSEDAPLSVAMHEIYHTLPELQRKALNKQLTQYFRQDRREEFANRFDYDPKNDSLLDEEISAFMVQAISKREDFWQDLRTKMGNKEFSEVAKTILARLNAIIGGANTAYGDGFVSRYISDVVKARDLLTDAYAQAMRDQGVAPDVAAANAAAAPLADQADAEMGAPDMGQQGNAPSDYVDRLTQDIDMAGQALSAIKGINLFSNLGKLKLTAEDWREIGTLPAFSRGGASARKLVDRVADGLFDEYLPFDMRHDSARFDEKESTEYIKDALRSWQKGAAYYPFAVRMEMAQLEGQIAELTAELNQEIQLADINKEIASIADELAREAASNVTQQEDTNGDPAEAQGSSPQEGLTSYSPKEIEALEKARSKREADQRKADAEADQRAQADAERDTFALTGSDRAADVGAAMGQDSMFSKRSIYHGTTPAAAKAIEANGFDVSKSADGSIWFTSNPDIGEVAASGSGAIVERAFDEASLKLGGWDESDRYSTDELIAMGYDGLKLEDDGETTYQIFKPAKLEKASKVLMSKRSGKDTTKADGDIMFSRRNAPMPANSVKDIVAQWEGKGIKVMLSENAKLITLSKIVVPTADRSEGVGTEAMRQLTAYADKVGKPIALTPSSDFGGSKSRLIGFYKRFGFVENKGRNKDYEISEAMHRPAVGEGMVMFSRRAIIDKLAYQGYKKAEVPRVQAARNMAGILAKLDAGKITPQEFELHVRLLAERMADVSSTKEANKAVSDRQRGADIVREKLIAARRRGEIEFDTTEFALWALQQNPALAEGLGISVRDQPEGKSGVSGDYNPATSIMRVFKGSAKPSTAVHEILHHTERMMPEDVQKGVRKEWANAYAKALKKASPSQRVALENVINAIAGDIKAQSAVRDAFADGTLDADVHYQLVNPSEFWAVNATDILQRRYEAGSWIGRAKQWLSEMLQKAKGLVGMRSNAPVLRGLEAVLNGNGERLSNKMLLEGNLFEDIAAPGPDEFKRDDAGLARSDNGAASPHKAAAQQIADTIQREKENDPFATFALRIIPGEFDGAIAPGDVLPESYQWDGGTQTDETLDGTSAIGIKGDDASAVEKALRLTGAHGGQGPNGYYWGDRVVLVKGESIGSGEDVGEILLSPAEVVEIWKKPTKGNSEVQPNPDIRFSNRRQDQTQTAEFKRWFGDSVVTENGRAGGKPLVVYHGTRSDFTEFSLGKAGSQTDSGWLGRGFYFGVADVASGYAGADEFNGRVADGAAVIPVYLSLEKPAILKDTERGDGPRRMARNLLGLGDKATSDEIRAGLLAAGHDGVIYKRWSPSSEGYREYVAFFPTQIKSAIGNTGAFDPTNPNIRFSNRRQKLSTIGQNFTLPATSRFDAGRIKLQDDALRMKRVIEAVKNQGGTVGEAQNFYDAITLMPGRVQVAMEDFRDKAIRPLVDKAVKFGIDLDELALYAYAKHAEERNDYISSINNRFPDGGSGMTNADADVLIAKAKDEGKEAKFEELHRDLMAITATTRQVMLTEGLINQDEFDALDSAYENYIPLRGLENVDESTGAIRPGVGRGINVRGGETIKAMGRRSRASDLIENVIRDYERVITRVDRNDPGKVLLDFVLSNPDPDLWGVDVERSKPALNKVTGLVQYTKSIEKGEDTIGVKVGGEQVYIKFADKDLTRALRQAWKDETSGFERTTLAMTGWWSNWLRNVLTRYNPAFAAINIPRDALWSGTTAALAELGQTGLTRYLANYGKALMASARQEAGVSGTANKIIGNQQMDRAFQEFRSAGSITGGFYMRSLDDINKDLRNEMLLAGAKSKNTFEAIKSLPPYKLATLTARMLEFMGSASENATRFALYQAARDVGKTPAQAALLAKDGTTNFNRKGEWGGALNNLYLFFNAAVQGNAQLAKVLKSPAVQASMAGVTGVGFMLAMLGASAGGEDDDGEAYWDKIPSYVKERNLVFMLPPGDALADSIERAGKRGRYFTVPVQYGFNIFPNIGYMMADVMRNAQDPRRGVTPTKAALHMTSTVFGSINPLGGAIDFSDGVQVLLAAMPTLIDLPIQLVNERGTFGAPSAPQKSAWDNRPDSERMFTSQEGTVPAKIAKTLNEMGGGNEGKGGTMLGMDTSVTPGTIQTLISATTGGLGSFAEQVGSSVIAMTGDNKDLKAAKIPFLNKFYGEVDESANIRIASDRARKIGQLSSEVKAQQEFGIEAALTKEEQKLVDMANDQKRFQKELSGLRKEELEIIADEKLTPAEKTLRRRMIQVERDKAASEFNKEFFKNDK